MCRVITVAKVVFAACVAVIQCAVFVASGVVTDLDIFQLVVSQV